jgi:outer membrane protein TolC
LVAVLGVAGAAAALALPACRNPFQTSEDEYGRRFGKETLRSVDPMRLEDRRAPQAAPGERGGEEAAPGTREALRRRADPFTGLPRLEVSIEQCRAWALENNLSLKVAMLDPAIAGTRLSEEEARFEAAFVANMSISESDRPRSLTFPDRDAEPFQAGAGVRIPLRTGGTAVVRLPIERNETFGSFTEDRYSTDVELSLSQPLLRGAGRWVATHPIRIAALDEQIVEAGTKLEVIRQVAEADRAYWLLYRAVKLLEVRQEQYEQAMKQLERADARLRARVGAAIEVTRAEAGVSRRLTSIIVTELLVKDRQRDLKRVINLPGVDVDSPTLLVLTSEPDPVRYLLDPAALLAASLEKRVELLELELQLAQDQSTIDFAQNQRLPLFLLDYTYRFDGYGNSAQRSFGNLAQGKADGWILGLAAEVPLGNEAANARLNRALLTRLQRLATRALREQAVKQEVLSALDNLEATWQRINAAEQDVLLEGRNYEAELGQFQLGLRTSTEVLDAETRLADAKANRIAAIVEYQIAQTDLAFATGMLLGQARVSW